MDRFRRIPTHCTDYVVMYPDGLRSFGFVDLPEKPSREEICALVGTYITGPPSPIRVVHEGTSKDMMVDERGPLADTPYNVYATDIACDSNPGIDADLISVFGVAVLFDRPVWFHEREDAA